MIKQPRYPVRFMQLNPDKSMQAGGRRDDEQVIDMTDGALRRWWLNIMKRICLLTV